MIARGDLAAKCGYERMAEVQEGILWICESAAHDTYLGDSGTRGACQEGTALARRNHRRGDGKARRVRMLNKGPYIVAVIKALNDILRRM